MNDAAVWAEPLTATLFLKKDPGCSDIPPAVTEWEALAAGGGCIVACYILHIYYPKYGCNM